MIVTLTENRFLQQVKKMELINWDWLGIHYAAQDKPLSKNVQLCNLLRRNVPFAFGLILRDPFMVKGGGTFFKKCFWCGDKFCGENL